MILTELRIIRAQIIAQTSEKVTGAMTRATIEMIAAVVVGHQRYAARAIMPGLGRHSTAWRVRDGGHTLN
jgi:hypothetical protein